MVVDHWQFNSLKELHSIFFWPSSSSIKSLFDQIPSLSTNLGFSFSVFCPGWKVFSSIIFMIFWFSFHISLLSSRDFSLIDPLPCFPPQSFHHRVGRFFTSNMTLWNLLASLRGQDILSSLPVFLLILPHWLGRFVTRFPFSPLTISTPSRACVQKKRQL